MSCLEDALSVCIWAIFPMVMGTFPKHIICSALRGHKGTGGRPSSLPLFPPPHHHPHRSHPLRAPVHPSLQALGQNAPPRLCDYEVKHWSIIVFCGRVKRTHMLTMIHSTWEISLGLTIIPSRPTDRPPLLHDNGKEDGARPCPFPTALSSRNSFPVRPPGGLGSLFRCSLCTGLVYIAVPRFREFCSCSCLPHMRF